MLSIRNLVRPVALVMLFATLAGILSACDQVNASDIKGLLQAMEGKEMIITLDDGTVVRVTIDDKVAAQAQSLIGQQVSVSAREDNQEKVAEKVEKRARTEDQKFSGAIESISGDTWTIGGRAFKVTATTQLDGGLAVGVPARVEFITMADGIMQATEIQTDMEDDKVKGAIESISGDTYVIAGMTFKTNSATRLDEGLRVGAIAAVEFVLMQDGTRLAVEIETVGDDDHFSGIIETMAGNEWTIGGKDFEVNAATRLDGGLAVGVLAKVEFVTLADGHMVATEIETDDGMRFSGIIEEIGATSWKIGGKTFTVTANTRIEQGLAVGQRVRVRFGEQAGGVLLAARIEADKSGSGSGSNAGGSEITGQAEEVFKGTVEAISPASWTISGRTFKLDAAIRLDVGLKVGDQVRVNFKKAADGSSIATRIRLPDDNSLLGGSDDSGNDGADDSPGASSSSTSTAEDQSFTGAIESISAGTFVIGGQTFKTDATTVLDTGLVVGVQAKVEFVPQADGSKLAREIETAKP